MPGFRHIASRPSARSHSCPQPIRCRYSFRTRSASSCWYASWLAARLIGRRLVEARDAPEAGPIWELPETQRRVGIAVLVLMLALLWPVTAGALVRDWREHPEP